MLYTLHVVFVQRMSEAYEIYDPVAQAEHDYVDMRSRLMHRVSGSGP